MLRNHRRGHSSNPKEKGYRCTECQGYYEEVWPFLHHVAKHTTNEVPSEPEEPEKIIDLSSSSLSLKEPQYDGELSFEVSSIFLSDGKGEELSPEKEDEYLPDELSEDIPVGTVFGEFSVEESEDKCFKDLWSYSDYESSKDEVSGDEDYEGSEGSEWSSSRRVSSDESSD